MSPHLILVFSFNTRQNYIKRRQLLTEEVAQLIPFEIDGNLRDNGNIFVPITCKTATLAETGLGIDHNSFSGNPLVIKNRFFSTMTHFRSTGVHKELFYIWTLCTLIKRPFLPRLDRHQKSLNSVIFIFVSRLKTNGR